MVYQIRKFIQVQNIPKFQYSLKDIYIFKDGFPNIGVKFRSYKKQQYGWHIDQIEIKQVISHQLINNQPLIQKWNKKYISIDIKININHLEQFNQQFKKVIINNKQLSQQLIKWLDSDIKQFYMIKKDKTKEAGFQKGSLQIYSILKQSNVGKFTTQCIESKDKQYIKKQIAKYKLQYNVSYPHLLQLIYHNKLEQIQLNDKQKLQNYVLMIQFSEEQKGLFTFYKQQAEQQEKLKQQIALKKKNSFVPLQNYNISYEMIHHKNQRQKNKFKIQNYQSPDNLVVVFQSNKKNIQNNLNPKTLIRSKRSKNIKFQQISGQANIFMPKSKISSKKHLNDKQKVSNSQEILKHYQLVFDKNIKSSKTKPTKSFLVQQICSQRVLQIKQLTNSKSNRQKLPYINSKVKTQHCSNFSKQFAIDEAQYQKNQGNKSKLAFQSLKKLKQLITEHKNKEKARIKSNYRQKNIDQIIRIMKKQKRNK